MKRMGNGIQVWQRFVWTVLVVLWGQLAYAQHVFDVGKKELSANQAVTVRTHSRQTQGRGTLMALGQARMSVAVAAQKAPGIVLVNDKTGRCAVLSGFSANFPDAELTPLLIAELKQSALGDAEEYTCVTINDLSAETPAVESVKRVSAVTDGTQLPIFKYGPRGNIKTANIGDRKLVNVFRMKPHYIPINPDDSALQKKMEELEESHAYYAYTYQMPDGTRCTYDEMLKMDSADTAAQNVTAGTSLVFDLSLSGMTTQQQTASQAAAGLWGAKLVGTVPVSVSLTFTALDDGVLGCSYSPSAYEYNDVLYPSALRNQMAGTDLGTTVTDIRVEFNTQYAFYFGTDMNAGSSTDYITVLLHEMAHGLGFYDSIVSTTGGYGYGTGDYPLIYDTFLYYNGSRLTALSDSGRYTAIRSAALYFDGPNAKSANGGSRIRLYAPTTYSDGSSVSHWDTSVTFSTFMKYAYVSPVHTIGTRKLGLMKDLGWTLASDITSSPSAPTDVSASDDTYADKVRVAWTASSGATSYKVYRSVSNSSSSSSLLGTCSTSPYDDASAVAGTTYYYWVKASNSYGDSGYSSSDSGRMATPTKTLSSIAISGASSVTSGNTANYTCTATYSDGSTATVVPTWSLSSTTYATITAGGVLTAKTVSANQSVTVVASYTEGGLTSMAQKSVTIQPSTPTVPAAPTISTSSLLLSWSAVSGASYYRVYRATAPFDTPAAITSWQTATEYTLTAPPSGTIYYYWVKAAPTASDDYASAFSNMRYDTVDNVTVYTIGAEGGPMNVQDGGYMYQERLTYTPSLPLPSWVTPVLLVDTTEYTLDQIRVFTFNTQRTVYYRVACAVNSSSTMRMWSLTKKYELLLDGTTTISEVRFYQAPGEVSATLTVNPTSVSVAQAGGSSAFSVSANISWSVTDDASWLTVSPSSGSGDGTVTVTATSANTSTSSRSATVTVSGGGITRTVTVTQPGVSATLTVAVTSISVPQEGGSSSFSVSANISWSVTDDASWLTVSPSSGSGDGIITVTATSANTSTSSRSATVTVSGGGITRTVTVPQPGLTSYTVALDANGGSGGSASVVATYGQPMPSAAAPTRSGYTFQGYWDTSVSSGGTQYYTSTMGSARNWDKSSGATLYARWTAATTSDYEYTISNGKVTITNYTGSSLSVTIPSTIEGLPVTAIGDHAFNGCKYLMSVSIPESVQTIEDGVFAACTRLTNIIVSISNPAYSEKDGVLFNKEKTMLVQYPAGKVGSYSIPSSVTSIEGSAFEGASLLTSISISDFTAKIGSRAFKDCTRLTSVSVPLGVIDIGDLVFAFCPNLTDITVDASNLVYSSEDGILFNKDKTILIQYPEGRTGSYVIPQGVMVIRDYAFYQCGQLTGVTIPFGVTAIGNSAFYECGLSSLSIPASVTSIGESAFFWCSSLYSVSIPASTTSIGDAAFAGCYQLLNITVSSSNTTYASSDGILFDKANSVLVQCPAGKTGTYTIPFGVTSIRNSAFLNCKLSNVIMPSSLTIIGDSAFKWCSFLKSTTISPSVTKVGSAAYMGCTGLTNVVVAASVIGDEAFSTCYNIKTIDILDSVTDIGKEAFIACFGLTSVVIPSSVANIGNSAFERCTKIKNLTIPASVTNIGDKAFAACSALESISVDSSNPVYSSSGGVLLNKAQDVLFQYPARKTGSYTVPSSVTAIGCSAFEGNSYLRSINIPVSITNIGDKAFVSCSLLTNIIVESSNSTYSSVDGVLFNKGKTVLIQYPTARPGSYTIPSSVTVIGDNAFYGCNQLTGVTIPSNVAIIGNQAFYACSGYSLTSINIPSSVRMIGDEAFRGCSCLTSLTISSGVVLIGEGAFCVCNQLTSVSIPSSVTAIGDDAFNSCDSLQSVIIGNGVTVIGDSAFAYCNLTSVTIPSSVTVIGDDAFNSCDSLQSVIIGNGVTVIGDSAFDSCTSLQGITLGDSVDYIGNYAFSTCSALTSAVISAGAIGREAFRYCGKLREVSLGNGISSIGGYAFTQCSMITSVTISDSVNRIGSYAFWNCSGLTNVVIGAQSIGEGAFESCSALAHVSFGDDVVRIGYYSFASCTKLSDMVIPDSVTDIGYFAFNGCASLTSVTIPSSVTSIGGYAFYGCTSLAGIQVASANPSYASENGVLFDKGKSVLIQYPGGKSGAAYQIPGGVTSIGGYAFYRCTSLTGVTIPDSVTSIGDYAFYGCTSLTGVTIPDAVTSIGSYAFYHCDGLTSVKIPSSMMAISDRVFQYCVGLTDVTILSGVTTIGIGAFYGCTKMSDIMIPSSVTNIRDYSFHSCYGLTNFYYIGDAPTLGTSVFYGCTSTVYYVSGTTGWASTYGGLPTAVWTSTATFNGNGGTPSFASRTYNVDNAYGTLPIATRSGYIFNGWRTGMGGTGSQVTTSTLVPYVTTGHTLYAAWTEILQQVASPSISPTNGTAFTTSSKRVTITCATAGAEIRFTTNGVAPTVSSDLYASSFNIYATTTVKARAFKSGMTDSEIAVAVITKPLTITLADALDVPAWTVTTGGDASWTPEVTMTHDGADAARTGPIGASQTTWMQTSVNGAGTLTFWWRSSCEDSPDDDWDYLAFLVDGVEQARIDGSNAWRQVSATLAEGDHTLRWEYVKDDADEIVYEDCGWVDQIAWVPGGSTTTTEVSVPYAWLDKYGLVTGGEYEAAGNADVDGDGYAAWQEYVAGTVPTNAASVFQARIGVSNGLPVVTWMPDLGTARVYTVEGKSALTNAAWLAPTNSDTRFFRVKVDVP